MRYLAYIVCLMFGFYICTFAFQGPIPVLEWFNTRDGNECLYWNEKKTDWLWESHKIYCVTLQGPSEGDNKGTK